MKELNEVLGLAPDEYNGDVQLLQQRLTELGYTGADGKPLTSDGRFGPNTLYAVTLFKTRNKLGNTGASEGKIGKQSWSVLFSEGAIPAVSAETKLKPVYYSQEDARWRNLMYSNHRNKSQTIGTSGCGPTCMAMVISSLTANAVLPPAAAEFATKHGFRTKDDGTAWGFFAKMSSAYGLSCKQTGSWEQAKQALKQSGTMVIASMASGHFTSGGHYIVLYGLSGSGSGGWVDVFDPNADNTRYGQDDLVDEGVKDDGKVKAKESLFLKEARQFWSFSK